jgi:hypothetical protein
MPTNVFRMGKSKQPIAWYNIEPAIADFQHGRYEKASRSLDIFCEMSGFAMFLNVLCCIRLGEKAHAGVVWKRLEYYLQFHKRNDTENV